MSQLKPCPFCNKKLIHTNGTRVNRYYKGDPTIYKHFNWNEDIELDELQPLRKGEYFFALDKSKNERACGKPSIYVGKGVSGND